MIIGYARVSTSEQDTSLQLDALREGDTLIVCRLDRLGRSLKDLVEVITSLEERNIGFKSLTEAIDTTNAGEKLIFHIFAALAEFERSLIQERTKAGLVVHAGSSVT